MLKLRNLLAVASLAVLTVTFAPPAGAGIATQIEAATIQPAGQTVGVAHPITVTFDRAIDDRTAAERTVGISSPAQPLGNPPGSFTWLGDRVLQWTPAQFWPAHSTITVTAGNTKASFQTGAAVLGVADIGAHTFTVSIDGEVAREMPASMGKPKYPTPTGSFTVLEKQNPVVMDSRTIGIPLDDPEGYKLTVYDAVRINWGGVYIHSAPWSTGSQGYENVSHGCINLSPDNADWYYNTVSIGDPVVVQY
ncbi:L,D-transpeptidase [Mycolicibacterium sp. ND9-15]|uniref:L,D-transpeptidase n=1 Tax=Mycolicibacterium sp. ND9-15 TaxID=3042320 RepID=UPI002DDAF95D|nr:L,D-transpeptidase [Mycolicibacterium sp. ND9-15]WSE56265.1 L,D-transpeptidase [Mycolicibacterium sp. ND9-15]